MEDGDGVKSYSTLLYKLASSGAAWKKYDKNIEYVYTGYIREIVREKRIDMVVTPPLITTLGKYGSWYLYSNLYEYRIIMLDESGYYWYSAEDESSNEEMI